MYSQHHYYPTRYIVRQNVYYQNGVNRFAGDIVPVYKLFTLKTVDTTKKEEILVIEQQKWSRIALINVCEGTIGKLMNNGAELFNREHLYEDEIDARIQLAFVCSKHLVEIADVYESTNGYLNPDSYKKLLRMFYDEYPEKYI